MGVETTWVTSDILDESGDFHKPVNFQMPYIHFHKSESTEENEGIQHLNYSIHQNSYKLTKINAAGTY